MVNYVYCIYGSCVLRGSNYCWSVEVEVVVILGGGGEEEDEESKRQIPGNWDMC